MTDNNTDPLVRLLEQITASGQTPSPARIQQANDKIPLCVFTVADGSKLTVAPVLRDETATRVEISVDGIRAQLTLWQAFEFAKIIATAVESAAMTDSAFGIKVEARDEVPFIVQTRAEAGL